MIREMWALVICLSYSFLLIACNDRRTEIGQVLPPETSDPYLMSFVGKNIKFVSSDPLEGDTFNDTLELDQFGNIVRVTSPFYRERSEYDSNNFLIRRWRNSDITQNYLIQYRLNGDTLIQSWRRIQTSNWELATDTISEAGHIVKFRIDKDGKVLEELVGGILTRYVYSKSTLRRKDIYMEQPNGFERDTASGWIYDYDSRQNLRRITARFNGYETEVLYFSDGLLDSSKSTIDRGRPGYFERRRYRYHYYY